MIRDIRDLETVRPAMAVLPMGFSWSFHVAQEARRKVGQEALDGTPLLEDYRPQPQVNSWAGVAFIYAGSAVNLGGDAAGVDGRAEKVEKFKRAGVLI